MFSEVLLRDIMVKKSGDNMEREKWQLLLKAEGHNIAIFVKWMVIALVVGVLVGFIGVGFSYALKGALNFRMDHSWIVYFLPLGGLGIVWLYHSAGVKQSKGTNLVIQSIRTTDNVPLKMAPLIFISTVVTHLFGGSAGREGAALQLGGSLAHQLGRWWKLNDKDIHIITMCGMSAAFSALFGTAVTAAVFPLEVISVGIMYYAALVPCALASVVAASLAAYLGVGAEGFMLKSIPALSAGGAIKVVIIAMLCALTARLFCLLMHWTQKQFSLHWPNQYLRIVIGGVLIILLAQMFGRSYLGAGMDVIEETMAGEVFPAAFLLKMVFTAITLGCGFKGGEIVPSFFIGATLGALIGSIIGFPSDFAAALGLICVFCGVTNCPITSLLLSFELFGFVGIGYFLMADVIAYMLSGYESLYHEQKIMYSKFTSTFIGKE